VISWGRLWRLLEPRTRATLLGGALVSAVGRNTSVSILDNAHQYPHRKSYVTEGRGAP